MLFELLQLGHKVSFIEKFVHACVLWSCSPERSLGPINTGCGLRAADIWRRPVVRITCFPSAESKAGARAKNEASPRSYLYPETPIVADVCRNLILAFPPGGGEAFRASSDVGGLGDALRCNQFSRSRYVALFCRANRCASESPPAKPAEYGGIGGSAAEKLPTSLLGGGGSPSSSSSTSSGPGTGEEPGGQAHLNVQRMLNDDSKPRRGK